MTKAYNNNNEVRNKDLKCIKCGAEFVCTSGPPGSCWCHHSPNLLESWDLAGECVCPDCLALGKREEMLAKREENFAFDELALQLALGVSKKLEQPNC